MGAWADYNACCRTLAASDPDAVFCPECGHLLLRCLAPECRALITPLGHCAACIDVGLSLEKTAVLEARMGDCLSVPFVLTNRSRTRPLLVTSVIRRGAGNANETVPLSWEQLDAGRARAFAVESGPFTHGGVNRLSLTIVVAARFDDIEEHYAFSGDVAIDVEGADNTQIVQHFNLSGADFGTAGMVVANPRAAAESRRRPGASAVRTDVALERAERYEIQQGHRGYERTGARIPRGVEVAYVGFPPADRPADGRLLARPVVRCGRNGRTADTQRNPQPNDLCLRIYDPTSGDLDRDASAGISRRVCDLVLQDDRLYVRPAGEGAVALNGETLASGDMRIVNHGDSLTTPAGRSRTVTVGATFKVAADLVTHVRFEKVP